MKNYQDNDFHNYGCSSMAIHFQKPEKQQTARNVVKNSEANRAKGLN